MVSYTVKKAFKILEPRRTKERKEDVTFFSIPSTKLGVIDPSHELISQKNKAENAQSCYIHPIARHSNPELHTAANKWSSSGSVASFDAASVSSLSITSPTMENFDDELDMLEYDRLPRNSPLRRQSTGSSRAKSQQKLAKILGWNMAAPQWKTPRISQSAETLVSPISTSKSPFTHPSPSSWHTDATDLSTVESANSIPQRRRSSSHRSNSVKSTSSKAEAHAYDYQMRQFLSARAHAENDRARPRTSFEDGTITPRSSSPRSASHNRSNSNPNVHKPLPTTPSIPPFATIHPLSSSSFGSTATPITKDDEDYSPIMELSAEEASVLLSQPEPHELPTETVVDRAELPGAEGVATAANRVRSKSPTQPRSGSASGGNDFGPGHTLSVIEEEPWTTEDLAQFKVFELPAEAGSTVTVTADGVICPGLSPSSSMSSRKMRMKDSEKDAELEDKTESTGGEEITPTQTTPEFPQPAATQDEQQEGEGEEIIVIYDRRVKSEDMDMSNRSFLSLDDDTEEDETDTEETVRRSYRNSIQNSARNSIQNSARNSMRGWPLLDGDEKRNRRTSAETTKTAYTTTTERTFVDPDYSGDLAKNLDWM